MEENNKKEENQPEENKESEMKRVEKELTENPVLKDALIDAFNSNGYMILISRLKGETLYHTQNRKAFRNDDVMPSLDELAKLSNEELK